MPELVLLSTMIGQGTSFAWVIFSLQKRKLIGCILSVMLLACSCVRRCTSNAFTDSKSFSTFLGPFHVAKPGANALLHTKLSALSLHQSGPASQSPAVLHTGSGVEHLHRIRIECDNSFHVAASGEAMTLFPASIQTACFIGPFGQMTAVVTMLL